MSIFGKKQELSRTGTKSEPKKMTAPVREIKTQDISRGIISTKNELFSKYKISGKEADEFAKEMINKKHGGFLSTQERLKFKKDLGKIQRTAPDIKARIRAGNKLRFLKDKYGI